MKELFARLSEPSTYAGIAALCSLMVPALPHGAAGTVATIGGIAGAISIKLSEKGRAPNP
jgi:hypothetical protein